jgi:hypothetical protein
MSGDSLHVPGAKGSVHHFEHPRNDGRVSDDHTAVIDHNMPATEGVLPILFREGLVEGGEEEPADLAQAFPGCISRGEPSDNSHEHSLPEFVSSLHDYC